MAAPESWDEVCLVAISKQSGSDVQFNTLISSIDINLGMKDIAQIDLVGGVSTAHHLPETITTVTLDAYPVEVSTYSGTTGKGFFDLLHPTTDTTQPIEITGNHSRDKIRICILWTDEASATNACEEIAASQSAFRLTFADGWITAIKPRFTDKVLFHTITVKFPAYDNNGKSNIRMESHDASGSTVLGAINAYTNNSSTGKGWTS